MTMCFADIVLNPGGIAAWLVVGLISGWLAGKVMEGGGFGVLGDILLGLLGALIGGVVFGYFVTGEPAFWGTVLVAFLGACVLIVVVRAIVASRRA
jgi:uncharacterized membrane protein YeaQ/YmgE (transglycosylase-associated protein family)